MFGGKDMSQMAKSLKQKGNLMTSKVKGNVITAGLEFKIQQREQKFGTDYFKLIKANATQQELQECLDTAMADVAEMENQVSNEKDKMAKKDAKYNNKVQAVTPTTTTTTSTSSTPVMATVTSSPKKPQQQQSR